MDKQTIWEQFKKIDSTLKGGIDNENPHYLEARKHLLIARMLYVHSLFYDSSEYGFC